MEINDALIFVFESFHDFKQWKTFDCRSLMFDYNELATEAEKVTINNDKLWHRQKKNLGLNKGKPKIYWLWLSYLFKHQ